MSAFVSRAPAIAAPSKSSARSLRCVTSTHAHLYIYCGPDCIAYQRTQAGKVEARFRLGSSIEVWRLALHEFGCMHWPVVTPDEFEHRLPILKVTTANTAGYQE